MCVASANHYPSGWRNVRLDAGAAIRVRTQQEVTLWLTWNVPNGEKCGYYLECEYEWEAMIEAWIGEVPLQSLVSIGHRLLRIVYLFIWLHCHFMPNENHPCYRNLPGHGNSFVTMEAPVNLWAFTATLGFVSRIARRRRISNKSNSYLGRHAKTPSCVDYESLVD